MANVTFYYNNVLPNATSVVASTSAIGHPVTYARDEISGTYWESSAASATITIDMGAATSIAGCAVINHNNMSTLAFQGSTDNFSTTAFSTAMTKYTRTIYSENSAGVLASATRRDALYVSAKSYRYYRILMISSGSSCQIGHIYLFSSNYEVAKNFVWNYGTGKETQFSDTMGTNGVTVRRRDYTRKIYSLDFQSISGTQAETLQIIGMNRHVVFLDTISSKIYYVNPEFPTYTHVRSDIYNMSGCVLKEQL